MNKMLVIEDDPRIADVIRIQLAELGYESDWLANGELGLQRASQREYQLLILDVMLPGMDGIELCRALRASRPQLPILMLTALGTPADRVIGLESGADDYLVKPFDVRELQARVKALLRRSQLPAGEPAAHPEQLCRDGLSIDVARRRVTVDGRPVSLTATEFELLLYLARHPGRVFSRSQLLEAVWGYGHSGYEHTVNSHINRLRSKLELDPAAPRWVQTVWGVGYRFAEE